MEHLLVGNMIMLWIMQRIGCPVLCHIWDNSPPLQEVERAVKTRPAVKLMMAHQGGGYAENTDAYAKLMEVYSNLYLEICGSFENRYSIGGNC